MTVLPFFMDLRESFMNTVMKAAGSNSFFVGKQQWNTLINNNAFLTKALNNQHLKRPSMDGLYTYSETGAKIPIFPIPLRSVQSMADDVDALRLVIEVLQREIFKNGFEVKPKYKYKCKNPKCEKEYMTKPVDMQESTSLSVSKSNDQGISEVIDEQLKCDVCGKTEFSQPSPEGRRILQNLIDHQQNDNGQNIEQISEMFERDLDIFDQGYLLLLYDYKVNKKTGDFESKELKEMLTVSPVAALRIGDQEGKLGVDEAGAKHFVCVFHRNLVHIQKKGDDKPKCKKCNSELKRAVLMVDNARSSGIDSSKIYYGEGEVICKPGKYKPGLLYGYSPVFSIWSKCESLKFMDEYVRKYFDYQRPPRSLLIVGTKNINTLSKAWDQLYQKSREDPYGLYPLMVESDRGGRNMVQHVDLTGSLSELQFIEVRAEFKRAIGAMYGVLPLFEGDLPNGWSNDGLALSVTNRAVSWGQKELASGLFDPLAKVLGVDDWILRLKEGEATDLLREEQLQGQKISNAQGMAAMGFEPRLNAEGDFVYSSKPTQMDMMGAQGGLGGTKDNAQGGFKDEEMTDIDGQPLQSRPSDQGGTLQGTPASGPGTSLSRKGSIAMRLEELKKKIKFNEDDHPRGGDPENAGRFSKKEGSDKKSKKTKTKRSKKPKKPKLDNSDPEAEVNTFRRYMEAMPYDEAMGYSMSGFLFPDGSLMWLGDHNFKETDPDDDENFQEDFYPDHNAQFYQAFEDYDVDGHTANTWADEHNISRVYMYGGEFSSRGRVDYTDEQISTIKDAIITNDYDYEQVIIDNDRISDVAIRHWTNKALTTEVRKGEIVEK